MGKGSGGTQIIRQHRSSGTLYTILTLRPLPSCLAVPHGLMDSDSDPDPAIFVLDLQDANKKLILKKFFGLLLFEGTVTSFFEAKSQNKVTKQTP
jgi:hypothetical protein